MTRGNARLVRKCGGAPRGGRQSRAHGFARCKAFLGGDRSDENAVKGQPGTRLLDRVAPCVQFHRQAGDKEVHETKVQSANSA